MTQSALTGQACYYTVALGFFSIKFGKNKSNLNHIDMSYCTQ